MHNPMRARLDELFGGRHGYADLAPAMRKVAQAAGRVLQTADDRGWLWLMDEHYGRPVVAKLLPLQSPLQSRMCRTAPEPPFIGTICRPGVDIYIRDAQAGRGGN